MTKLPHENWKVDGVDGPKYRVGPGCAVPGCTKFADHAHHIWRRSFLSGDYKWVRLWDGRVLQNIMGICHRHHELVTVNEADLVFNDEGVFTWVSLDTFGPLSPQPLSLEAFEAKAMQLTIDGGEVPHTHVVGEHDHAAEVCPTCGKRKKPKDDLPAGEKRARATWSVSVPKDERENGAEVLDELILACAERLGRADHASYKYFAIVEIAAYFLQGPVEA